MPKSAAQTVSTQVQHRLYPHGSPHLHRPQKHRVFTSPLSPLTQAGNAKLADFLGRDFRIEAGASAAAKNAFALLGQHRYELAAAFFILAGRKRDAVGEPGQCSERHMHNTNTQMRTRSSSTCIPDQRCKWDLTSTFHRRIVAYTARSPPSLSWLDGCVTVRVSKAGLGCTYRTSHAHPHAQREPELTCQDVLASLANSVLASVANSVLASLAGDILAPLSNNILTLLTNHVLAWYIELVLPCS